MRRIMQTGLGRHSLRGPTSAFLLAIALGFCNVAALGFPLSRTAVHLDAAADTSPSVYGSGKIAYELSQILTERQRQLGAKLRRSDAEISSSRARTINIITLRDPCVTAAPTCRSPRRERMLRREHLLLQSLEKRQRWLQKSARRNQAAVNAVGRLVHIQAIYYPMGATVDPEQIHVVTQDLPDQQVDQLNALAVQNAVIAHPRFVSFPRPGFLVFYQSVGSRERHEQPRSLPQATNSEPQQLTVGCYYMWLGDNKGVDASDRNRPPVCLSISTTEVTLIATGG